ncbi:hypothetical protein D3C76_1488290 [compost metagenome]
MKAHTCSLEGGGCSSLRTTSARRSPKASSATAKAAASSTPGISQIQDSTSLAEIISPARLIMSLARSVMNRKPSSSRWPISPVSSQPSCSVSALVCGNCQ